jgi:AraC-like DNA-binding protein
MKYHRIKPSQKLADHVRYFWVGEVEASAKEQFSHYAVAASSAKMVFHYKGQFKEVAASGKFMNAGIQGQSKVHTQFITQEHAGMFGVEFFPYAIPSLFSIPATALTDQYIDLHTFLGKEGRELEEQILTANTNHERVQIVTRFLEARIKASGNPYIIDAINRINTAGGMINIGELAKQAPVSQRHFERLFREVAGFTPKLYARILRFETALYKTGSLTERALDAGYFDQAHFIRDFKEFTGIPPKNYFRATANLPDVENVQF